MLKHEYEDYQDRLWGVHTIEAGRFGRWISGTLLYGYDVDRNSFHVYLDGDKIHRLVFKGDRMVEYGAQAAWLTEKLIPNKRVYPEYTDRDFTDMVLSRGVQIPFTTWDDNRFERAKATKPVSGSIFNRPFHTKTRKDFGND